MMGCKTPSLTCLQAAKPSPPPPPPPPAPPGAPPDSTAPLHKLALATGGTEKSWYRCVFPFGVVSLVIGLAATCITFTINGPPMDIAKVVSVATLLFGLGLLVAALLCWRARRRRRRKQQLAGHQPAGPLEHGGALRSPGVGPPPTRASGGQRRARPTQEGRTGQSGRRAAGSVGFCLA